MSAGRGGGSGGGRGGSGPGRGRGAAPGGRGGPKRGASGPRERGPRKPVPRGAEATPAPEVRERPDVVYGRNPVFEALRAGRREVRRIWATSSAAKEPWLEGVHLEAAD